MTAPNEARKAPRQRQIKAVNRSDYLVAAIYMYTLWNPRKGPSKVISIACNHNPLGDMVIAEIVGYGRVSSQGRSLAVQDEKLKAFGCTRIQKLGSGSLIFRPLLQPCHVVSAFFNSTSYSSNRRRAPTCNMVSQ